MEEIERKFLLDAPLPLVEGRPSTRIRQGYIAITDDTEVRIRARGDDRLLTAKGGRGMVRREVTVPLTAEQFNAMWPLTEGRRVTKRRWVVPHHDIEFEIDVFEDHLDGLVVVEVEFPTSEASTAFAPPDWCGPEVTHDERYRNAALATEGMPDPPH
jgi:CYTH domain-containing protein